ncbi:MAG: MFS transporter [Dermatophilaceae bacterium]
MVGWALLADTVPIYPLYALFFADSGLSEAQISVLFAIWSATSVVAEVPSGSLADRFGRRTALVAASVLQAAGYLLWVTLPGFAGFAAGFVLWGIGGALMSGAREALLYDGLALVGARHDYTRANGWVGAATLLSEPPVALLATVLFPLGGYTLVGWVSVAVCLLAAAVATTLPEPTPAGAAPENTPDGFGYLDTLRAGVRESAGHRLVRGGVVAVALVGGIDAVEEYFPLVTARLGVPLALVPLAMVPISVASALGSALAGRAERLRPIALAFLLALAMAALGAGGLLGTPLAGIAAVCLGYGLYHVVLVVTEARLQHRIDGAARATVTSVAGLGVEIATFAVYAAWALGGLPAVAAAGIGAALALPLLLRVGSGAGPSGRAR